MDILNEIMCLDLVFKVYIMRQQAEAAWAAWAAWARWPGDSTARTWSWALGVHPTMLCSVRPLTVSILRPIYSDYWTTTVLSFLAEGRDEPSAVDDDLTGL